MQRYEMRKETNTLRVLVERICDGCGKSADNEYLMPVAIEVNMGEEYGRRDEYDYCNTCLIARAAVLVAAGSRSALVTGEDPADDEES